MMQDVHASFSLREKQRREREELILQAAEEIFIAKGYYEASMDDIAARVGIAKGTIYLHFSHKDKLVAAIIQHDMLTFLQQLDEASISLATSRAKLEAVIALMYNSLFSKHTQLLSNIYNAIDLRRLLEEKKGCMYELWENLFSRVTLFLEEGKQGGEFDQAIPTYIMAHAFFNLFSPHSYDRIFNQYCTHQETLTQMLNLYFKGITNPD